MQKMRPILNVCELYDSNSQISDVDIRILNWACQYGISLECIVSKKHVSELSLFPKFIGPNLSPGILFVCKTNVVSSLCRNIYMYIFQPTLANVCS